MDALILSCSTGGGHHAAAEAMREELVRRGHHVDFLDPYTLVGKNTDKKVGNCYIRCARRLPRLFGFIYLLGNLYRKLPGMSPVYWANKRAADAMEAYLAGHSYDLILTTHLFPGEILTRLKRRGVALPKTVFIATDYTCIPFTEETDCDYYLVPALTRQDFSARGIPEEKIISLGIPVRQGFREKTGREKALERLGLDLKKHYILLAGGSIGAGKILQALEILQEYLREKEDTVLIVVCGSNRKLYEKLKMQYGGESRILLLKKTECMAEYLKASDFYISKPGGISSTEAAVANIPLIHISPIPGCETKNKRYFKDCGMSIYVSDLKKGLLGAMGQVQDEHVASQMKAAQRKVIDPNATEKTADFMEEIIREVPQSHNVSAGAKLLWTR